MRRSRINPMSAKRRASLAARAEVKRLVHERDGWRCLLSTVPQAGPCFGRLEMHEVVKASQASNTYSVENGRSLCSSHNSRLESDADLARLAVELGLVVRRSA